MAFLHFIPAYTEYGYNYNQPKSYCDFVTFGTYKALSDVESSQKSRLILGQSLKKDVLEPLQTDFGPYYPTIVSSSKGCGVLTKYQYFIF